MGKGGYARQTCQTSIASLLVVQEELRQSNEALWEAKRGLSRHNASLTHELHATSDELEKTLRELSEVSSRLDTMSK